MLLNDNNNSISMTQFTIALTDKEHYQLLSLAGRLDLRSIHVNSLAVKNLPLRHTLLDCSGIDFIDSSGLGMLTSMLQRLKTEGKSMALIHVPKTIMAVLQRTRLDTLFHIVESETQALSHFG